MTFFGSPSAFGPAVTGLGLAALLFALIVSALSPRAGLKPPLSSLGVAMVGGVLWLGWGVINAYLAIAAFIASCVIWGSKEIGRRFRYDPRFRSWWECFKRPRPTD